jgi:glucosamine 6-phosphate synthetase-like amidotransferase/phosphosugar isomerase protein
VDITDITITLTATEEEDLPHIMEEEIMLLPEVMPETEAIPTEISQIEVIQTEIAIIQIEEASIQTLEEVLL